MCGDFPYQITDKSGKKKTVKLTEKRVVTFNSKLKEKQIFEIEKQVEKAKILKASQAKKSEYGDSSKYVTFKAENKKGEKEDAKIKVEMNEKKIKSDKQLAGYNMIVTSEINMPDTEIYSTYHNLWRIEESFKIMKSQLVPCKVQNCIKIILICFWDMILFLKRSDQYAKEKI